MHKKTTRAGRAAVARAKYAASKRSRKHPVRTAERPVRRTDPHPPPATSTTP